MAVKQSTSFSSSEVVHSSLFGRFGRIVSAASDPELGALTSGGGGGYEPYGGYAYAGGGYEPYGGGGYEGRVPLPVGGACGGGWWYGYGGGGYWPYGPGGGGYVPYGPGGGVPEEYNTRGSGEEPTLERRCVGEISST